MSIREACGFQLSSLGAALPQCGNFPLRLCSYCSHLSKIPKTQLCPNFKFFTHHVPNPSGSKDLPQACLYIWWQSYQWKTPWVKLTPDQISCVLDFFLSTYKYKWYCLLTILYYSCIDEWYHWSTILTKLGSRLRRAHIQNLSVVRKLRSCRLPILCPPPPLPLSSTTEYTFCLFTVQYRTAVWCLNVSSSTSVLQAVQDLQSTYNVTVTTANAQCVTTCDT